MAIRMSDELQTIIVLAIPPLHKKVLTKRLDFHGLWWDDEKQIIPDLTFSQIKIVTTILEDMDLSYATGPTTSGE